MAAADLRGTGYPDLVLANDYGVNEFYANQGGKKFVEIGKETRVGDQSKSGMSVSFGDIYNQGNFAIYVTNITEPEEQGTRVTRRVEMTPPGMMRLMTPMMKRVIGKSNAGFLANLKRLLEGSGA